MLYSFAGTSILKGVLKVRFANSEARARQLTKLGDTDVNIVALPMACDKASAVRHLLDSGFATSDAVRTALEAELSVPVKARLRPKFVCQWPNPNPKSKPKSQPKKLRLRKLSRPKLKSPKTKWIACMRQCTALNRHDISSVVLSHVAAAQG